MVLAVVSDVAPSGNPRLNNLVPGCICGPNVRIAFLLILR